MSAGAPDYLLIGHITADITPNGRVPGGTVSYAIRTAAAFGLRVGVLTSVAENEPLLDELRPYADIISLPAQETTTFENLYFPEGRVQYVRGVAANIYPADIPQPWLDTKLVHLAPIAGELDSRVTFSFPNAYQLLTLQGWLRKWDLDGRVRFKRFYEPDVLRMIGTVVFSEEDIVESPDMEADYMRLVRNLFVTRAEKGGTYYDNGVPYPYTTPQVELVHPTGAGDVFATSLLASLPAVGYDYHRAVQVAAKLGAISVTRFGLDSAPTPDEVRQALAEVTGV
jgi:sugar/nucleoside kinase (ribokinase family)